jgi:hypothetical protein
VTVRRTEGGGFQVLRRGKTWIAARPDDHGLSVSGAATERRRVERAREDSGGFLLRRGASKDAPEIARSTRPLGSGGAVDGTNVILADGRTYTLRSSVARGQYELYSWDGFGPYATIRPARDGWKLHTTIAGEGLTTDPELVGLLAAELVDEDAGREGREDEDARCKTRVTASRRAGATGAGEEARAGRVGRTARAILRTPR